MLGSLAFLKHLTVGLEGRCSRPDLDCKPAYGLVDLGNRDLNSRSHDGTHGAGRRATSTLLQLSKGPYAAFLTRCCASRRVPTLSVAAFLTMIGICRLKLREPSAG